MAEFASKGVAGSGLGLGIAGTALGLMNGGLGNFFGGWANGCGGGNAPINRYEAEQQTRIAELETEVKLRDANAYTSSEMNKLRNYVDAKVGAVEKELCDQRVYNERGTSASATEFGLTAEGKFTPPTDTNETRYIVKYNRTVSDGLAVYNKADKFPGTVKLTLKALCVDPCEADTLRACYIVLPSFQVSPEVSISLQTDAQADYKGDLQVAYCTGNKTLYEFYMAADDEE